MDLDTLLRDESQDFFEFLSAESCEEKPSSDINGNGCNDVGMNNNSNNPSNVTTPQTFSENSSSNPSVTGVNGHDNLISQGSNMQPTCSQECHDFVVRLKEEAERKYSSLENHYKVQIQQLEIDYNLQGIKLENLETQNESLKSSVKQFRDLSDSKDDKLVEFDAVKKDLIRTKLQNMKFRNEVQKLEEQKKNKKSPDKTTKKETKQVEELKTKNVALNQVLEKLKSQSKLCSGKGSSADCNDDRVNEIMVQYEAVKAENDQFKEQLKYMENKIRTKTTTGLMYMDNLTKHREQSESFYAEIIQLKQEISSLHKDLDIETKRSQTYRTILDQIGGLMVEYPRVSPKPVPNNLAKRSHAEMERNSEQGSSNILITAVDQPAVKRPRIAENDVGPTAEQPSPVLPLQFVNAEDDEEIALILKAPLLYPAMSPIRTPPRRKRPSRIQPYFEKIAFVPAKDVGVTTRSQRKLVFEAKQSSDGATNVINSTCTEKDSAITADQNPENLKRRTDNHGVDSMTIPVENGNLMEGSSSSAPVTEPCQSTEICCNNTPKKTDVEKSLNNTTQVSKELNHEQTIVVSKSTEPSDKKGGSPDKISEIPLLDPIQPPSKDIKGTVEISDDVTSSCILPANLPKEQSMTAEQNVEPSALDPVDNVKKSSDDQGVTEVTENQASKSGDDNQNAKEVVAEKSQELTESSELPSENPDGDGQKTHIIHISPPTENKGQTGKKGKPKAKRRSLGLVKPPPPEKQFYTALTQLNTLRFKKSEFNSVSRMLLNTFINPNFVPDLDFAAAGILQYLQGCRNNPLASYAEQLEEDMLVPLSEKCLAHTIFNVLNKNKPYLDNLIDTLVNHLHCQVCASDGGVTLQAHAAMCRVLTAILKQFDCLSIAQLFAMEQLILERLEFSFHGVAAMASVWPDVLYQEACPPAFKDAWSVTLMNRPPELSDVTFKECLNVFRNVCHLPDVCSKDTSDIIAEIIDDMLNAEAQTEDVCSRHKYAIMMVITHEGWLSVDVINASLDKISAAFSDVRLYKPVPKTNVIYALISTIGDIDRLSPVEDTTCYDNLKHLWEEVEESDDDSEVVLVFKDTVCSQMDGICKKHSLEMPKTCLDWVQARNIEFPQTSSTTD